MNYYIDKNVRNSYMIIDDAMQAPFPEPVHDVYWDTGLPEEGLPYTAESKQAEERIRSRRSDRMNPENPAYGDILPSAQELKKDLELRMRGGRSGNNGDLRRQVMVEPKKKN